MPFFFNKDDKSHLDKDSTITYNYYAADIPGNAVTTENSDNGLSGLASSFNVDKDNPNLNKNIKVDYYNPENTPNITYPDNTTQYTATTLRIFSLLHTNILNVTCNSSGVPISPTNIAGELVIEHTSLTGYDTIYTCFLLTDIKGKTKNSLDNLIEQNGLPDEKKKLTINLNLNSLITNSDCITYRYINKTVIVFTKPLNINNTGSILKQFSNVTGLFKMTPSDGKNYAVILQNTKDDEGGTVIGRTYEKGGKVGQHKDDDIYIDCSPTGEKADQITTYNVPINSEYTQDASKIDFMKATIHLCLVIILLIVVYFVVPIIYKGVVIDNINKFMRPKEGVYPDEEDKIADNMVINGINKKIVNTFVRLRSVDVTLVTIFLTIFGLLIYEGFSVKDNFDMIMYALYFSIMFGLSFATIQFSKNSNDFMRTKVKVEENKAELRGGVYPDELQDKSPVNYLQIGDVIVFLGSALLYIFTGKKGYVFLTLVFLAALTLFILMVCYWLKKIESFQKVLYIFMIVCTTVLAPVVPTAILCSENPSGF